MAILIFLIVAALGIVSTVIILFRKSKNNGLASHQYALILAIGLGLTWMLSFLAPLVFSGWQFKSSLLVFIIVISVLVFVMTYGIARIFLSKKKNKDYR